MWARRQAHETAIHRVDAELAAGTAVTPFSPTFAADGVDELLSCFVTRRSSQLRSETPASLAVCCTDADAAWLLRIDADRVTTDAGPGADAIGDAACSVRGPAADLYLALWNRAGPEALAVEGDRGVLGAVPRAGAGALGLRRRAPDPAQAGAGTGSGLGPGSGRRPNSQ